MKRLIIVGVLALGLAACGTGNTTTSSSSASKATTAQSKSSASAKAASSSKALASKRAASSSAASRRAVAASSRSRAKANAVHVVPLQFKDVLYTTNTIWQFSENQSQIGYVPTKSNTDGLTESSLHDYGFQLGAQADGSWGDACYGGAQGLNLYVVTKYSDGEARIVTYFGSVRSDTNYKTWGATTYHTRFATTNYAGEADDKY